MSSGSADVDTHRRQFALQAVRSPTPTLLSVPALRPVAIPLATSDIHVAAWFCKTVPSRLAYRHSLVWSTLEEIVV